MSRLFRFVILLVAVSTGAGIAVAAGTMGPIEKFVLHGAEGAWQGTLSQDAYRLENTDPHAGGETRYFFLDPRSGDTRYWTIAADVKLEPSSAADAFSFGGIIFAVKSEPRTYLVFAVDNSGKLAIYHRGKEGLKRPKVFSVDPLDPRAFNELRVVEQDGRYQAFANGDFVGSIETDLPGTGGVGIIAAGTGTFLYRDFDLLPAE